ncbi:hypothetical protein GCM10022224_034510 [Nonomuraea antimicrobica]|uniref:Uncharacterized protein n=1 Tax=Nonomuraea antimicrobica TaxID=561173 RepID=A0ABP7BSG9_9ACTN
MTEIHTRYEQYVERQKAEAQAKVERDRQRADLERRQRDELRQQADSTRNAATTLLELEALQARLRREGYAGADALSFTETRKVGTGEVVAASVHKVTCKLKTVPGPAKLGFNLQAPPCCRRPRREPGGGGGGGGRAHRLARWHLQRSLRARHPGAPHPAVQLRLAADPAGVCPRHAVHRAQRRRHHDLRRGQGDPAGRRSG